MAWGKGLGFIFGRWQLARQVLAQLKLKSFVAKHPQYRDISRS
jgi:hypothetical protein